MHLKKNFAMKSLLPVLFVIMSGQTDSFMKEPDEIILDGSVTENLWEKAKHVSLKNGGELLLLKKENTLWAALKHNKKGWVHVYQGTGDTVRVLHASAALGEAVYIKKDKKWEPSRTFQWELRDKVYNEDLKTKQENYYKQHGWVANNNNMSDGMNFEFKIHVQDNPDKTSFAFVILDDPDNPHYYPFSIKDDALLPKLLQGYISGPLVFELNGWEKL
jgi:hypothetical protein